VHIRTGHACACVDAEKSLEDLASAAIASPMLACRLHLARIRLVASTAVMVGHRGVLAGRCSGWYVGSSDGSSTRLRFGVDITRSRQKIPDSRAPDDLEGPYPEARGSVDLDHKVEVRNCSAWLGSFIYFGGSPSFLFHLRLSV
jgi:hypothetical protein